MKTAILYRLIVVLVTSWSLHAGAATLSLVPASVTAAPGSTVSLDLVVSGLGDTISPSLGDFDIDIGFDSSALSLTGYSLGSLLGDVAALEALDVSFGGIAPGLFNVAEVSFLTDGELDTLQSDSFVLATLEFMLTGLADGDSAAVALCVIALGDATGSPISVDAEIGATITAAAVPLPGAVWLFAAGLGVLARLRSAGKP